MGINANCEGTHCTSKDSEVRVLPVSLKAGSGSNSILCHACYNHEIVYRKERNRNLAKDAQFQLPAWESLEVYGGAK